MASKGVATPRLRTAALQKAMLYFELPSELAIDIYDCNADGESEESKFWISF